ncbi:MAG: hypothetical protein LBD78_09280 [Spirochaetaceae bacterium]|jgi:hypothetical protein|nr:hypothetical protein [Spirochaetaceae bacterium]
MRKHLRALLILPVLVFLACDSAYNPEEPEIRIEIPQDLLGMVHAGSRNEVQEYKLLDDMGVSWMLRTFNWSTIEPGKGNWNFADYDAYIGNGKSHGKKIFAVLAYDTSWLYGDGQSRNYISPEQLDLYCAYVKKTVERYKGSVDAWGIWNEPNISRFWTGTAAEFYELTKRAAAAIREADPGALIVGGAFNTLATEEWIRGLFESGAMEQVDALSYHPYSFSAFSSAAIFTGVQEILAGYHFDDKIWVTEVGFPTGGSYLTKVSEENMPEQVVKTIVSLATAGAVHVFWYQLFDPAERNPDDSEDYFGLLNRDYTPKGGKEAYALCSRHIPGTAYRPGLPVGAENLYNIRAFYFEGEARHTLIIWGEGDSPEPKTVRIFLPGSERQLHNPVDGSSEPVDGESTDVSVGGMPRIYTWENTDKIKVPRISVPGGIGF